jgi:phytoene dehydrogenase-like protein
MHDIIIIGGGHNGLTAAAYCARAGLKTIVLERREIVGGAAVTEEIHSGYRCSSLAHSAGPLSPKLISDLELNRFGLEVLTPEVRLLALSPDSKHIAIYNDANRTASEIANVSAHDAASYPGFVNSFSRIGNVLAPLVEMTPPSIEHPSASDLWSLGKLGLAFRGLGRKDEFRLLRWGPMAVADLVSEWFETELIRAAFAARGIYGAFAGPWSAGTSLGLLWQAALDGNAIAPASFIKGGLGALTTALAESARSAGAEIQTKAEVARIELTDDSMARVILTSGSDLQSRAVISNADPHSTFLRLVDPIDLDPTFTEKIRNYRIKGAVAKINLALSGLPHFNGVSDTEKLKGRIHIGPEIDYLERAFDAAKYGEYSPEPYLDVTIPSLTDATLAPAGHHVMSIHVQFAPYKLTQGDWSSFQEAFADNVIDQLARYAPNLKELIVGGQVLTPVDLERTYGLAGGHIHHGEQTLDQFFTFRPLIGWAQYRTPLNRLYLCGAGTHPGGGITGLPGSNAAREVIKDFKNRKI